MNFLVTDDGSHTLFNDKAGQTYHSSHGAITESSYIFIDRGLRYWADNNEIDMPARVLEIGFGTALNVILSERFALENNVDVDFSTVDLFPIASDVYCKLNYGAILDMEADFASIHQLPWNAEYAEMSKGFRLQKFNRDIVELLHELYDDKDYAGFFNVIYFDAFSPDSQPELWTRDVFECIYGIAAHNAVMVTYCSKGDVRRSMEAVGFNVEKLAGPPGKRHILRAVKL